MPWEEAPISNDAPHLGRINKEMGLKYYSVSRDREIYDSDKRVEGTYDYNASLIIGEDDIFLPFLDESRSTPEEMEHNPERPYYKKYMTFLGLNISTNGAVESFGYPAQSAGMQYFTITANHDRMQEYFDLIADAYFESQRIHIARYKDNPPPFAKQCCTAFIYICPETGKEFIKQNPYL